MPGSSDTLPDKAAHLKDHQFKPGQSGNPSGVSAFTKLVRDLCRENERGRIEDIILELYDLAMRGKGLVKLEAAKYLVDRVGGKATVAVSDADGGPIRAGLIILPARETS